MKPIKYPFLRFCFPNSSLVVQYLLYPGHTVHLATLDPVPGLALGTGVSGWHEVSITREVRESLSRATMECVQHTVTNTRAAHQDTEQCVIKEMVEQLGTENTTCGGQFLHQLQTFIQDRWVVISFIGSQNMSFNERSRNKMGLSWAKLSTN